jgi:hypothetical protein
VVLLRAHVDPATFGAWWSGLALLYLGVAHFARLPRDGASAVYMAAYALLLCAQAPALLWSSEGPRVLALGIALAVSVWSIYLEDRDAGLRPLLNFLPQPWRRTVFTWVAAVAFPLWALLVFEWRGGTAVGAGIILCAVALLYSPAASRLHRAASPRAAPLLSVAYVLSALGPVLALADRTALSVTFVLDAVLLANLAKGIGSQPLADLGAAASIAAILTAPPNRLVPRTPAMLAAVAFLYSVAAVQAGRIQDIALFRRSLFWASRVLAAVTFLVASGHLAAGRTPAAFAGYATRGA